jgi:hypothetical protein
MSDSNQIKSRKVGYTKGVPLGNGSHNYYTVICILEKNGIFSCDKEILAQNNKK